MPDKPGYLEIDPEMAEMVKTAFTSFLREGCLSHAAIWLNDNGYALKKHMEGVGRFRRVGHFTVDNLQAILRNKAYIGVKIYSVKGEPKETKAVWPAIIDEVTFQRVGKILDKNRRKYKPHKQGKMPYLFSGVTCCMNCKSPMSGKSATGRAGKVGYYEHVWATKRDSTLSKKIFKCDPHRVPSKILEPAVWEKVVSFATHPDFARKIFEKVKSHHKENPQRQEIERTRAKIFGVNSQIEALSERIAELPKDVSAAPLFRQLAKLQAAQKENEKVLADLKNGSLTNFDRIASLDTFDDFTEHYRTLVLNDLTVTQKKQFVQKFVKKIEVGEKTYKIHFIVDEEHFKRELALKEVGFQPFGARRLGSSQLTV